MRRINNFLKLGASLILMFAIVVSCTDDFEDINTQSDALIADNVDANLLGQAFAQSQYHGKMGLNWRYQISQSLFADLYSQYFATTASNFDSDQNFEVGRWIDLAWSSFYGNAAPQLDFVIKTSAENGLDLQNAVARVWRVYGYHRITDYWGPVIYSEFGNGEPTVAYDTQEFMYKDFFKELDAAVAVLKNNPGGSAFGSNDLIFGGDASKWLTFANSLRLRLAMRIRYVEPQRAQQEAEKAIQDGVMTNNADNAAILTTGDNLNPFTTITNWGEFRMSAAMESVLDGYDDPRIGEYFNPAVNPEGNGGKFQGLQNGIPKSQKTSDLNDIASDMETKFLNEGRGGTNPDIRVMSVAEVFLLRAEGALQGWSMGGSAQQLYEDGIRYSMEERTGASAADIDAYINSSNTPKAIEVAFTGSDLAPLSDIPVAFETGASDERKLEQIITQKWIALYPDGWEAFAEMRRTGYPERYPLMNSLNPDVGVDEIMRRFTYVAGEFSNNAEAVEAATQLPEIAGNGGDKNSTRVWWDVKGQ